MNKHKNTTSQAANRHNRSCHRILPRLSMPSERSRTLCLINKCTCPISLRMFFHGNGIHNKILRSIFLLFTWWITNSWWKKTRVPVGIGNSHSIKFDMSALIIQVYAISNNDTLFSKYDWIGNYSFKTFILKGDILLCLISLCSRRGSNFYHIHNSATFNSGGNKSPEFRQSFLLRMQM